MIKRRAQAKELCDDGVVRVNGRVAKASREVKEGDIVEIDTIAKFLKFRVVEIPKGKNVSKKRAKDLIEILEERKKDIREVIDLL